MAVVLTPGQFGDAPQMIVVLCRIRVPRPQGGHPRTRPDHLSGDKAHSSRRSRRYLPRRPRGRAAGARRPAETWNWMDTARFGGR